MRKSLVFGGKSTGLLASFSPSDTHQYSCWKTSQTSFEWAEPTLLEALPQSGMTSSGRLYQLHNAVHPTSDADGLQSPTQVPSDTIFGTNSLLPTPTVSDAGPAAILNENTNIVFTGKGTPRKVSNNGVNGSLGLARTVMLLPTPSAHEHKYRLKGNSQASRCLEAQARRSGKDFQLNPQFVEEMMGFPIGWTDLEHSETQSSHNAQNGSGNKS
jgi:hypothetical protein